MLFIINLSIYNQHNQLMIMTLLLLMVHMSTIFNNNHLNYLSFIFILMNIHFKI